MIEISVGIVVKNQTILIIKRAVREGDLIWQFPAGKIEFDENPASAAEREVFEETNIQCKALQDLGVRVHPSNNIKMHYFVCEYLGGNLRRNSLEVKTAKWKKPDDIRRLITTDIFTPVASYLDSLEV